MKSSVYFVKMLQIRKQFRTNVHWKMYFYSIIERRVNHMLFYELKKLFSRTGSKLLLLLLGSILIFTAIYNIQSTHYVQPDGTSLSGISAIRELKKAKSQWNGILTEEQIKKCSTNQSGYSCLKSRVLSRNKRISTLRTKFIPRSRI